MKKIDSTSLPKTKEQSEPFGEFFAELAQVLIESGISAAEAHSMLLKGYVRAATKQAKFRNKNINRSAVAAITGLTRPQVRSLLADHVIDQGRHSGPIENLVNAWLTEPSFSLEGGMPRPLTLTGNRTSFAALVRRFGSDIPPKAMLGELTRRNLAKIRRGHVHLIRPNQQTDERGKSADRLLSALAMAMRGPGEGLSPRRIRADYSELTFPELMPSSALLLRRRVRQSIGAISADLGSAVAALEKENPPRSPKRGQAARRRMSKMSVIILEQV